MGAAALSGLEKTGTNMLELPKWNTCHLIDGALVEGNGAELRVENPATEEVLATLREPSPDQAEAAILAARRAFESGVWRDPAFRAETITRMADALEARKAEFLATLVADNGTPVSISEFLQIGGPLGLMRDIARRALTDRTVELTPDDRPPASRSIIRYEPVGVVAAIGAYNNPLLYIASKAVAAMAAGCTVVFCPSALAPLSALLFAEIVQQAGVPAGVLNIVAAGRDGARLLTSHPQVDKVSLTGSVEVGRQVMAQAAPTLKGLVLELGGKSPGIILPGADLATISLPLHARYLRNAGQGCQSPTRLMVPRAMMDDFIDLARASYDQVPIGDPQEPATLIGPLISHQHRARVEGHVADALADGGQVLAGGGRPNRDRGWYHNGTLIGGLENHARLARTELFGPVAMVMPYDNVDEMVALSNDSDFGLAATIFGPTDLALQVAPRLRAGTVQINGGGAMRVDSVLTGWKQSGLGREWGDDGIREFLEAQHIQWTV